MGRFVLLVLFYGSAAVFAALAYRARHAKRRVVAWTVGIAGSLLAALSAALGTHTLAGVLQYYRPPANPPLSLNAHGTFNVGLFVVSLADAGQPARLRVTHTAAPERELWASLPDVAFVGAAAGRADIREFGVPEGSFAVDDSIVAACTAQTVDAVEPSAGGLVLRGTLSGPRCTVGYRLTFTSLDDRQLQFGLELDGAQAGAINRIYLRSASDAQEHIFGFGEQMTFFDQKGNILPILVQEHGVGRGLPMFTQLVNWTQNGGGGTPFTTEAPAPHYMTSRLRSLFLENTEYSIFDMHHADRIETTLFAARMTGRILYGATPLELIENYTTYAGRMRALPEWIHRGAIISVQGGTEVVRRKLDALVDAGVPIAALWIQDWPGKRVTSVGSQLWWNWQLDRNYYPEWDQLVDELARHDARMLLYINPFLTNAPGHDTLFREAQQSGYLVRRSDGSPYLIRNTNFSAGMVDLSNSAARSWMKRIIGDELIGAGRASGWMADFGEALPFDAQLYDGADPAQWHNQYPEVWAETNRQAIEEAGRGDDIVFFDRSGFTRSPGQATLFWLGDQLQTWDQYDGIKSALVGMLSGGVSGFSLVHSDTGGYNAFAINILGRQVPIIARSKELWMRWVELSAFTSVLRTHEGLNPAISAQIDSDAETLAHFARMARIYAALAPYRQQLVDEASRTGHPVARHPFLEYPDDPTTYTLRYQYLLGSEMMVAPVVDAGATSVRVYLPAGSWTHVWSGVKFESAAGRWIEVAAPLGQPAVLYRTGSAAGEQFVAALAEQGLMP